MSAAAPEIFIHEVGLRDGLQMEKQVVATEQKIAWIEALLGSWVDILQLGSFVHPKKVPQMADTDRLFAHFSAPGRKPENVVLSGLVLATLTGLLAGTFPAVKASRLPPIEALRYE